VPSNIVSKVVEDLMTHGAVQRAVLGVQIVNVSNQLSTDRNLKLNVHEGVFVESVYEKSAAEAAGIKEGDVIVAVNGTPVRTSAELIGIIGRHRPGDEVKVRVNRNGNNREIPVKLKNLEETQLIARESSTRVLGTLGAEFANVDRQTARRLNIEGGVQIKSLKDGKLKGSNVKEGFIITKIDGKPVRTVEELTKALEGKKGGVMMEGVNPETRQVEYFAFGM
jgi:serine protease Do